MRALVIAFALFTLLIVVAPVNSHRLPREPVSIQLIHKIDHAKQRVDGCTRALGWRRHRVVGVRYQASGTPVAVRTKVLGYWRDVARRCERHVLPFTTDWLTAIRVVQRVFPGTAGWLESCSAAESNHGSWVWNGSAPLAYVGQLRGDRAGGYLQFRYSTYDAHDDKAFTIARHRGYAVPVKASYWNAIGQAIVGGYMRWAGVDNAHWSASWGRGC